MKDICSWAMVWSRAIVKKLMKIQNVQVLTVEKDELNLLIKKRLSIFCEHKLKKYISRSKSWGHSQIMIIPTNFYMKI